MPLIVFEGIDGSGTTTQSKALVEQMCLKLPESTWIWTCQPTKGPIGQFVRSVFEKRAGYNRLPSPHVMLHLFQADKEEHYEQLRKWLADGANVVCDRYWYSGWVYQAASSLPEKRSEIQQLIERLNEFAPEPDVLIYLSIDTDVALGRGKGEADLYTKRDYLQVVNELYEDLYWNKLASWDKKVKINTGVTDQHTTTAALVAGVTATLYGS